MSGGAGGVVDKIGSADSQAQSSMPTYGSQTADSSANRYTATYAPMQQAPQQAVQDMGLQAIYQSIANQFAPISQQFNSMDQFYQQPAQQQAMPAYQNPALNYRPDTSGITANLNRVAPNVKLQQQQAAEEAARAAANQGYSDQQPEYVYDYNYWYGGGG